MYSVLGTNNVLFSSIINNRYEKEIKLISVSEGGTTGSFYASVKACQGQESEEEAGAGEEAESAKGFMNQLEKTNLSAGRGEKEDRLLKVTKISKNRLFIDFQAENVFGVDEGSNNSATTSVEKKRKSSIHDKYNQLFGMYLSTLTYVKNKFNKLKMNEVRS